MLVFVYKMALYLLTLLGRIPNVTEMSGVINETKVEHSAGLATCSKGFICFLNEKFVDWGAVSYGYFD